jgi:CubicO group peptidase (beta-lactamase class C family)
MQKSIQPTARLRRTPGVAIFEKCAAAAVGAMLMLWPAAGKPADRPPPQVSGVPIPDGQIDKAIGQLDALAADVMAKSGVPGMAVAVVRDGKTVYAKGFGLRKAGEPALVDADTVFQLASLSKPISATIVAHQVGLGAVAWDMPVVKTLPWFRLKDAWVTAHLTVGDLLSHRSGLPDHAGDALEDLGYDQRQVLERLRLLPLAPFRVTYAYTNFGFTAAAAAVAAASGADWATLAEAALYKPLGMNSTSSRFSDFEKQANRAVGHVKIDGTFQPRYQRQPDAQSPAGGVSSSANDMARWMSLILQNGKFEGHQIIDAGVLLPAVSAQIVSSPSSTLDSRPNFYGYGFGVSVTPAGRIAIQHSGAFATGAATNFVLLPSAGIGIVVLTNASPVGAAEALGTDFTDLVQFGKIQRDWLAAYAPVMESLTAPAGSLLGKPRPANPAAAAKLSDYLGTYHNDYYGEAQIVSHGDGLVLKLGPAGIEYPLVPWDGDAFTFNPSNENQTDGSISLATFKSAGPAGFNALTVEYLDEDGMGSFVRQ